nr:hypothetical protein [Tanacetum cinerariifolium]
ARDAEFLWERVGKVMGSSWSSGGVVRSGEEVVAGLAGENGTNWVSTYAFNSFKIWQD